MAALLFIDRISFRAPFMKRTGAFRCAYTCGIMIAQDAIQTANYGLPCFAGIIPASHRLESKYRFRGASFPAHVV